MHHNEAVLTLTRRDLKWALICLCLAMAMFFGPRLSAQKVQDKFDDKFKVGSDDGGVGVATSDDGKYVYVAGKLGLVVSDDHGKTGSWVQTLRLK